MSIGALMTRSRPVTLLALLALAVTTGCTDSGQPDAAPQPSASTQVSTSPMSSAMPTDDAPAVPAADPQQVLDAALANVRQAPAVAFDARSVSSVDNAVTTRDITGVWVSQSPAWETTTKTDAPSASLDVPRRLVDRTDRLRYVDSRVYVADPFLEAGRRNWFDVTASPTSVEVSTPVRSKPAELWLLFRIEPTSVDENAGGAFITGTIPNEHAIEALGLSRRVLEIGLVEAFNDGQTTVRLTLDKAGFPTRFEFLGADVGLTSTAIPEYRRTEVDASSFRADYQQPAKVPVIPVPKSPDRL